MKYIIAKCFVCNVGNITNVIAGEFGVVYRGNLTGWRAAREQGLVAVKTLKGIPCKVHNLCLHRMWACYG